MNLQGVLLLCGIVAVVLLILQFFTQVHRIKRGRSNVGGGRVFINWLLVILIIGGFGGSAFLSHQNKQVAAHPVKTPTTTTKESADSVTLVFDKKVELNDKGEKKVNFDVSPNTKVKIVGHYSRNVFKTFNSKDGETNFSYTFDQPGTYDIIATNGSKKVVKKLVVKDHSDSSEDSSSEDSSSSSSSSSSRSSSNNSNSNRSNNSNNSQSTGGSGSSNSGRGGSSYSGGGSSYRGGGGGGNYNYTPAAPSRPASTPSAPSNGTGAMTGGSY